jgi:hypothetical protein
MLEDVVLALIFEEPVFVEAIVEVFMAISNG